MSTPAAIPTTDYRTRIAANVKAEIARAGLNARQIAAALGLTEVYVGRRLNAKVELSGSDLALFADFLGVPASRFFLDVQSPLTAAGKAVDPAGLEPTTSTVVSGRFGRSPAVERPTLAPVTAIRA